MSDRPKSRGLGRGLSALMADVNRNPTPTEAGESIHRADMMVPIEKVKPNPDQPRRSFTQDQLEELAASIKEKGIIQPLIVRERSDEPGSFEIVAGERRWRAAQMAMQHTVPVIVRDFDDTEVLEVAIIENIQRADLNAVEEAVGYKQLMEKFGHTQEKLSEVLGKSRSYIANLVRLLQLPEEVQEFLREGKLTAGHARALITSDDPLTLAKKVIHSGLSVRETEKLAKKPVNNIFNETGKTEKAPKPIEKDADTRALEDDLSAALSMKVSIDHESGKESGKLLISYKDFDQLDELCRKLSVTN
ncbi:Chromosome-partitioning protein ParB [Thalassovita gelatinovora]|uniref:Chromosome-partitioning protein ParB n=1 Tax=Thalassovita gelatinovora TaxID=53501 RepID=A0A0N7LV08_THAGE|nr:ParB/RepB/Spo0J family partition protein [Thalassovita gelatinovora]QIZ81057.1 ParB/RepB/Spo0J family partition protein [Thalassovita gelatinovora]CUH64978.1 Chromosome-partitioning protein ParB [Thalassovita gelatinovora]SEP88499.1 chromosome partitioning protein, ParB family [Thalassovita gelatinovora]